MPTKAKFALTSAYDARTRSWKRATLSGVHKLRISPAGTPYFVVEVVTSPGTVPIFLSSQEFERYVNASATAWRSPADHAEAKSICAAAHAAAVTPDVQKRASERAAAYEVARNKKTRERNKALLLEVAKSYLETGEMSEDEYVELARKAYRTAVVTSVMIT